MKLINRFLLILFALILSLLDTSFFSNLQIGEASIISVYTFIIIFAIRGNFNLFLIFVSAAIICFSVFSSLPVWLICIVFLIIPSIIFFLRKNYLPFPTVPVSGLFFLAANLLFEMSLLLYAKEWSKRGFEVLGYFLLINSIFGVIMFYIVKRIRHKITREEA